jgi:D-alanyl-D-alanine carboxypeptidase
MLLHTSGLPDIAHSDEFLNSVRASPHHADAPRQIVSFVFGHKLNFRPGTEYEYSNTDNLVIGLMIQKATGRSYYHEMEKNVLRPLHLGRTSLTSGRQMPRPFIHGSEFNPNTNRPTHDVSQDLAAGWAWASGGVISTPGNLNRFIRGYVSGKLVSPRTKRLWYQLLIPGGISHPIGPGFNAAGPAVYRYQTRCGTVYGHTGNVLGYTQFALSTRDGSRSATVSVNMQVSHGSGGAKRLVFEQLSRVVQAAVCTAMR